MACRPTRSISRSTPTGRHFDPEQALVPVLSNAGDLETLKIDHPWAGQSDYRVLPGRLILHDQLGKTVEAFSFGGDLRIVNSEALTTCTLASNAPILNLASGHMVAEALAEEIEILLAELDIRFAQNPDVFHQKQAALDPMDLYTACLFTLQKKFKRLPVVEGSPTGKLNRLISSEMHSLQDRLDLSSPPSLLADLFSP